MSNVNFITVKLKNQSGTRWAKHGARCNNGSKLRRIGGYQDRFN